MEAEQADVLCQGWRLTGRQLQWLREWIAPRTRGGSSPHLGSSARRSSHPGPRAQRLGSERDQILSNPPRSYPLSGQRRQRVPGRFRRYRIGLLSVPRPFQAHYRRPVGQNLQYLVGDRSGRWLAGLVFGAAAWKCAPRDQYIGWDSRTRELHLHLVANNMRWLVLPWVRVPQLASHLLGLVAARISSDWQNKYGHRIYLLETFVERARFSGACYQAAQWIALGSTQGRSRNDSDRLLQVPCKEVYVYPLTPSFGNHLCSSHQPTYRPTEVPIHGPVDSLPS
jgi:hypothetical protein